MKEKIDEWLSVAGLELIGLIAGGFGAAVALLLATRSEQEIANKLTAKGRLVSWLAGMLTAAYLGPLVIIGTGLPIKATAGVIFFIGLAGMSLAESLLKQMPDLLKALRTKYLGG